jgi:hypothetical protein
MSDETMVSVSVTELISLREDSARLSALERAGVDNWGGYDYAMEILRGDDDE